MFTLRAARRGHMSANIFIFGNPNRRTISRPWEVTIIIITSTALLCCQTLGTKLGKNQNIVLKIALPKFFFRIFSYPIFTSEFPLPNFAGSAEDNVRNDSKVALKRQIPHQKKTKTTTRMAPNSSQGDPK